MNPLNVSAKSLLNSRLLAAAAAAAIFAGAGFLPSAIAKEPTPAKSNANPKTSSLKVGDPAPALSIGHWIKGEPITGFEKGRVYVVEFWATWCPPCRASIPHLTEMAHKFKKDGVTFIGVDSSTDERLPSNKFDTLEKVQKFVKQMGDTMDYNVALETKDHPTSKAYMDASDQRSIPCAFVVDRAGNIAWIGNPLEYLESVIEDIVAGSFDPKKQAEIESAAYRLGPDLAMLAQQAKWDEMLEKVEAFGKLHRTHLKRADATRYQILLTGKQDYKAAYALGNTLVETTLKDDAMMLNEMAWTVLDDPTIKERDLKFAMKAAQRASDLTKHEDPTVLDTLARAYFDSGDAAKAIEIQTKAIELCTMDEMKAEFKATLEKYQNKK